MTDIGKREFLRTCLMAAAVLAVSGPGQLPRLAEAAEPRGVSGICLYVPRLGKAGEFIELLKKSAPGNWRVEALEDGYDRRYFQTRELCQQARRHADGLVGVVDPASFAIIQEAVADSGGSFHYVTYQERGRVTFSVRL